MHEPVLVLEVRHAAVEQRLYLRERALDLLGIAAVHLSQRDQGVGHESAQRLVHHAITVVAVRGGGCSRGRLRESGLGHFVLQ
jgi:hypothetical protein